MEYKQFETFQNVSLKELQEKHKFLKKLQEKHNLNKNLLNSSINELKSSKKQHTQNLKNNEIQNIKLNSKLNSKVNKLINKTNKLLGKKKTENKQTTKDEKKTENKQTTKDEKTTKDKKETKVNIVSSKKEISSAEKKTNQENTSNKKFVKDESILIKNQNIVKTEPNQFGKIIPIVFTIIAIVCSGLLIYTKQVNVFTLLLLSLVVSLTIICYCAIGNFCILDTDKTMWARTKLGQRCNYTKNMYFTALLCGFLVSYIIFSYDVVITLIQNIKKSLKNLF